MFTNFIDCFVTDTADFFDTSAHWGSCYVGHWYVVWFMYFFS